VVSVIAIDGPAAAGKTAVGRELARRLEFRCLDTGIMYRAITWLALRCSIPIADEAALGELAGSAAIRLQGPDGDRVLIDDAEAGPELRDPEVDRHVSLVSRVSEVRRALVRQQRALAAEGKIVMLGRDIGTVVLPGADLKVFMTASAEERARRRWRDLAQQGHYVDFSQVLQETRARDEIDSHRADSPLVPAQDAFLVDTTENDIGQVVDLILEHVQQRFGVAEK
jgi:CMP/dCMP kinase